jgi:hypothetical protein
VEGQPYLGAAQALSNSNEAIDKAIGMKNFFIVIQIYFYLVTHFPSLKMSYLYPKFFIHVAADQTTGIH